MTEKQLIVRGQVPMRFGLLGSESIKQNLNHIVSTINMQAALDRDFGLEGGFLDAPQQLQEGMLTARIYAAVEEQEPRATITEISFVRSEGVEETGMIVPIIKYIESEGVSA